jgi:hypothetical protein
MDAITLTFGDCMENHVGMQKVGTMSSKGYSLDDLLAVKKYFDERNIETILYHLNEYLPGGPGGPDGPKELDTFKTDDAYFLVIKNGLSVLNVLGSEFSKDIYNEHIALNHDKKYYDTRRKKVLNKLARWNLCFDETSQVADYENKKGTIVSYNDVPFTNKLRLFINDLVPGDALKLEANYYYDIKKTGIKMHGDSERRKVIGVRLGADNKMAFKWFKNSEHIGTKFETILSNGDIYMMSEKTVGTDWKMSSKITLRHAAGCEKYTK